MFLYEKKIIYLTFYWDGVKKSSAGFVKVSRERDACKLDIHIKHIEDLRDGKYTMHLVMRDREAEWGSVTARGRAVNEERSLPILRGRFRLGEKEYDENELCGILIRLDENRWIAGQWQEIPSKLKEERKKIIPSVEEKQRALHAADESMTESIPENSYPGDEGKVRLRPVLANKWGQLQRVYRSVHPFGDERIYLSVEPKDFIVLQAPYQRLVNNSFLLHGYYNYRHLILGPDEEIGTGSEICFYLGVPGTYFEREKMVAVMFGFEGFECAGPVEVGKFGYYMRRVEL